LNQERLGSLSIFFLQDIPDKEKSLALARETLRCALPFAEVLPLAVARVRIARHAAGYRGLEP